MSRGPYDVRKAGRQTTMAKSPRSHTINASPAHTRQESTPLSRDIICTKALELADTEGIENVSIRKIAAELGKTPMALYRHCESIEDIRQGVVALAFREVDTAPVPGERWDDTVRRTTASMRVMWLKHAHAHLYQVQANATSDGLFEHTTKIQALHQGQGIPEEVLQPFWRIIDAFLTGFEINEIDELEAAEAVLRGETGVKTHERPDWAQTTEGAYTTKAFREGVEIIIAGVRSLAAPDPCDWKTPEA